MPWAPLAIMAVSAIAGGMAQKKAADAKAEQGEQNAQDVLQISAENEKRQRVMNEAKQGKARTQGAALGATGSDIADILSSNAEQEETEALQIKYDGQRKARNYRTQAEQDTQEGKDAMIGGFLKAGSSLYGGGGGGGFGG